MPLIQECLFNQQNQLLKKKERNSRMAYFEPMCGNCGHKKGDHKKKWDPTCQEELENCPGSPKPLFTGYGYEGPDRPEYD